MSTNRTEPPNPSYPAEVAARERELLHQRRKAAGAADKDLGQPALGVGLSGGGIRSATFALGFFEALARAQRLGRVDWLSTVSGGGYFGAFLGALFARGRVADGEVQKPGDVEQVLLGERAPRVLRHLRENGRYLSPNGSGDLLLLGAVVLRNWVALQLVILTTILSALLGFALVRWHGLSRLVAGPIADWIPASWAPNSLALWWSPWWVPAFLVFLLVAFPLGWAYWLAAPRKLWSQRDGLHPWVGVAVTLVAGVGLCIFGSQTNGTARIGVLIISLGVFTVLFWVIALALSRDFPKGEHRLMKQRNWLSSSLKSALSVVAVLAVLTLIDSLGQTIYYYATAFDGFFQNYGKTILLGLGGTFATVAGFARQIVVLFGSETKDKRPKLPLRLIATIVALAVMISTLVALSVASHAIAWEGKVPFGVPRTLDTGNAVPSEVAAAQDPLAPQKSALLPLAAGASFVFALLFGLTTSFLVRSSHHPLYHARLARAYLGASNPNRRRNEPLSRSVLGDDLTPGEYWPQAIQRGAPLHVVNLALNETVSGESAIEQLDRKGFNLAVGPAGISAKAHHHLLLDWSTPEQPTVRAALPSEGPGRVFRHPPGEPFAGEALPIGKWVALSGAAFSTGTGYRTNLGLSLLAGFANVRLGHWWRPGTSAVGRPWLESLLYRFFNTQCYLGNELLARFPGTARGRWYLSDGGHFENLAGYELIRRRLPRIVLLDAGADAGYELGDLANFVRKARLDFGAEITFLDADELDEVLMPADRAWIGTLEDLRPLAPEAAERDSAPLRRSRRHGALARVVYQDEDSGWANDPRFGATDFAAGRGHWLLYLKPTVLGSEPADVLAYQREHVEFPHETTADQFFDEAQWESYRRLGQAIGDRVLGTEVPRAPAPVFQIARVESEKAEGVKSGATIPAIPRPWLRLRDFFV